MKKNKKFFASFKKRTKRDKYFEKKEIFFPRNSQGVEEIRFNDLRRDKIEQC